MKKTGIVFDIQRCSLHDGPGIRTTIFLKGCPLRCEWCHNPESQSGLPQISFNQGRCINCFSCIAACPQKAHWQHDGVHELNRELCISCGKCVEACSAGALKVIGEAYEIEEIMSIVKQDVRYYERSGGGVTLSGGEPIFQLKFISSLLASFKAEKINTCLETCGYAAQDKYAQILPMVDTFLFDYKDTDTISHKLLTGVANELILSNLDFLYKAGASIILRCPLVPGINDSPEHLEGIADIALKYPKIKEIEIMAYHDMGRDKNYNIGCDYKLIGVKTASEEIKEIWLNTLAKYGCSCVKIG